MGIFDRTAIAVVTHNRPQWLAATLRAWAETAPDYRIMFIIANHPEDHYLDRKNFPPNCQVVETGRPPEHLGNLSQSWNLAMLWAFRDPEVEWLLCSQDDVVVMPGWVDCVRSRGADLYLAPGGDTIFLFNRRVFREAGWFDERFTVMGFHEWDWQARVLRAVGTERVVIEDKHGWQHNPVGLSQYWRQGIYCNPSNLPLSLDTKKKEPFLRKNMAWIGQKWGKDIYAMIAMISSGVIADPLVPEIDWYPWLQR